MGRGRYRGGKGINVVTEVGTCCATVDTAARCTNGDFSGYGLVQGDEGGVGGELEGGDYCGAGKDVSIGQMGPGCDAKWTAAILGLDCI